MIYYQVANDPSLVSQFLDLGDENWATWPNSGQTTTSEFDPSTILFSSSSSVPEGGALGWELEPSSLHLVDMKKFETIPDLGDGETASPWPWGNYTYRPPTPPRFLEPEECIMELELAAMERMLREELTEAMAEEAIRGGEKAAKRREFGEGTGEWGGEVKSNQPSIIAFNNRVVHGRTIYNP